VEFLIRSGNNPYLSKNRVVQQNPLVIAYWSSQIQIQIQNNFIQKGQGLFFNNVS
jgi:hypothetical protein